MNAILHPVLGHKKELPSATGLLVQQRFFPFLWSSLWTLFGTGIFMTLLSPRFRWLDVSTFWSQLLTAKIGLFFLLLFVSWQAGEVVRKIGAALQSQDGNAEVWHRTFETLIRRSIVLGILSLLCAAGMAVV